MMKTFFVLLAVAVVLLAVMMVASLVPLGPGQSRETKSQIRVHMVASALTQLSSRESLGSCPPTSVTKLRGLNQTVVGDDLGEGNELNRGVECVFVALHLQGVTIRLDLPDDALGNTDGDVFPKNVTSTDTLERMEILDAWGSPLAYFHSDDYEKSDAYKKIRMSEELGGVVETARPSKRASTGLFINPRTFQVFSAGADGVFNTPDDLGNWERSPE